jgi:kynurenine formamidase
VSRWRHEVLANPGQWPATGAVIVLTWPKVENGFPARAFAILL